MPSEFFISKTSIYVFFNLPTHIAGKGICIGALQNINLYTTCVFFLCIFHTHQIPIKFETNFNTASQHNFSHPSQPIKDILTCKAFFFSACNSIKHINFTIRSELFVIFQKMENENTPVVLTMSERASLKDMASFCFS